MKNVSTIIVLLLLLAACQPSGNSAADQAFEKNAATIKTYLKAFQDENIDYSIFSDDFVSLPTGFGTKDTLTLDEMKASDKNLLANYNFRLEGFDSLNLLPGVNPTTGKPDGSVRYYGKWDVTRPATDSTAAKTGILKTYESFDFDKDGKILFQQIYGDFTGLDTYLNSK